MKILKIKLIVLTGLCTITVSLKTFAQQGQININQDKKIDRLLVVKKEMNKDENATDRFKIQVYSGSRVEAEEILTKCKKSFSKWKTTIAYETPNYKIWIGSYRTRLEADRALNDIKEKYPNGFIFQPKAIN